MNEMDFDREKKIWSNYQKKLDGDDENFTVVKVKESTEAISNSTGSDKQNTIDEKPNELENMSKTEEKTPIA